MVTFGGFWSTPDLAGHHIWSHLVGFGRHGFGRASHLVTFGGFWSHLVGFGRIIHLAWYIRRNAIWINLCLGHRIGNATPPSIWSAMGIWVRRARAARMFLTHTTTRILLELCVLTQPPVTSKHSLDPSCFKSSHQILALLIANGMATSFAGRGNTPKHSTLQVGKTPWFPSPSSGVTPGNAETRVPSHPTTALACV